MRWPAASRLEIAQVNDRRDEHTDEELVQDDEVIGRAFRRSVAALAVLIAVGAIAWVLLTRQEQVVEVEEAEAQAALSVAMVNEPPAVPFTDVTSEAGIDFVHSNGAYGERLLPETMGSGAAFFDYDNDGDPDLLLVNSTEWPWHGDPATTAALYRNDGNGRFSDVTAGSGLDVLLYGMGVAVADYDADGWRDVYLTAVGANRLFRNLGDGRFEDVTAQTGVAGGAEDWSSSAAFFDFDNDGDLDLFSANYVEWSREIDFEVDYRLTGVGRAYGPPTNYAGTNSKLFRNDGGIFTDVSAEAGVEVNNPATGLPMGKGLAVTMLDYDDDGFTDVLVANDTVQNFLFRNRGDGSFEEIGALAGVAYDNSGSATGAMGIDAAWYLNNDDIAVAIGNFANEMTSFYVAPEGTGLFTDEAIVSGIGPESRRALSFGVFFFDYDLDGRLDALQTNGHVENEINTVQPSQNYEQPTQLFWNCGLDCKRIYVPVSDAGDLHQPVVGRGAAYADIDADGDLDVLITQTGRPALLLRNDQQTNHNWVRILLQQGGPNRDAIGAVVEVETTAGMQRQRVVPSRSYLSQVELPLTFGLGESEQVQAIRIDWPDGAQVEMPLPVLNSLTVYTRSPDQPAE
ncbi:MAG: CRTAC1 family protein [Gammaproteobacteria bacterium]|nr:CRTAC1 family protein [Gammaproteobacteria bacterium]